MKKTILLFTMMLFSFLSIEAQQINTESKDESCPRPGPIGGDVEYLDYYIANKITIGNEPPAPFDQWIHYDDGNYDESIGFGMGSNRTMYWGSMFPMDQLYPYLALHGDVSLTKIALYESGDNIGDITVNIYLGYSIQPSTLVHTQTFSPIGIGFHEVTLSQPIPIPEYQHLWITFSQFGDGYPAAACADMGNPNNRWVSLDGENWEDLHEYLDDYSWMIRGYLTNHGKEMELTKDEDWQLQYYQIYWSKNGINYRALDSVPYVEGQTYYEYFHNISGTIPTEYYHHYYKVTAVYADADGNLCESEPGLNEYGFEGLEICIASSNYYDISSYLIPKPSEWYYEIQNENGSITYQNLLYSADTTINDKDVKIIVRINTLYDKEERVEVTHEYIYKENFTIYWWNKTLGEFTLLNKYTANVGDQWDIKVGNETITVHVDAKDYVKQDGIWYDRVHLSDENGYYSGYSLYGIGNMTSFFPEKLMKQKSDFEVDGLRCYWRYGIPVFSDDSAVCDAVWVAEEQQASDTGFELYPNPTDGIIHLEMSNEDGTSRAYRVTNLMGQTLMTGSIHGESQEVDVSNLPRGMYFITVGNCTQKFVVR